MNNEEKRALMDKANEILSGIAQNLEMAQAASDPHPIEKEYLDYCLEDTCGRVYYADYEGWVWLQVMNVQQAIIIINTHGNDE